MKLVVRGKYQSDQTSDTAIEIVLDAILVSENIDGYISPTIFCWVEKDSTYDRVAGPKVCSFTRSNFFAMYPEACETSFWVHAAEEVGKSKLQFYAIIPC